MQRQGRSRAEARKVPVASPNLVQTAPSWAGSLEARQVWARLAPGKSGQASPQAEQPRARNSARSGLSAELELCDTGGALGSTPARLAAARDWAVSSSPEEAPFHLCCALGFQAEPYLASCRSWLRGYFPWAGVVGGNPDTQGQAPTTCTQLCWGEEH